jgi:arylsulfatase A-like enzyme
MNASDRTDRLWSGDRGSPSGRLVLALAAGAVLVTADAVHAAQSPERPNVLVIFTDDQRADTLAALGNPVIRTPHLDRLVSAGVAFRRAYMMGAMVEATCVPSRAMLLGGRSLFRADTSLAASDTWPAAFGRAGYATFMSGKWHNAKPGVARSFAAARAVFTGGMGDPTTIPLHDLRDGKLAPRPGGPHAHACEIFADEAVQFLKDHDGCRPFLLYLPFDAPHDPHIVPEGFPVRYDPAAIPLPPNFLPVHPFDNGEMEVRDEVLLPKPRPPDAVRQMLADYYRYISYLDGQIGRVLDALAASPHATNTYVVFAGDSGVARGSHGLIGKQNLYEHSIRVPLIVGGPGIARGRTTDAMAFTFDILPTLGELCGIPAPDGADGRSLARVLHGDDTAGRKVVFAAYKKVQRSVRDERWKWIVYPAAGRTQLFDLNEDPFETRDLSAQPDQAERRAAMQALLEREQRAWGDPLAQGVGT